MLRRVFNLIILGLVSSMINEAITANTNRIRVSNQPWAASPLLRNTFDGADDQPQECQCVIFYLCEEANTIKNDSLCEDSSQVCCRSDSTVAVDDFSPGTAATSESSWTSASTSAEPEVDGPSSTSSTSTEFSVAVGSNSSPSSAPTPECGIRKLNGQSSNSDISFGEFPWMVAILRTSDNSPDGTLICGGSLLSRTTVLTAAHCIHNVDVNTLRIRAGDFIINGDTDERLPHQERRVNSIITHSNYSSKVLHNDLAMISVNEPFNFEDHIAPACFPNLDSANETPSSNSYNSQDCLVTGWTRTTDNTVQNKLRKVSANVLTRESCENNLRETRLGRTFKLHPSFLCAKEQESVCKGLGGGPLVCVSRSNPNKYVQVGVVSWGIGCDSNLPGVYASLETNTEWLATQFNVMQVFVR